jgi:hypothetical protein
MSERRPDPPEVRASVVDSGWGDPDEEPERILPVYEDPPRELLVTRVDDQIQARVDAMKRNSESQLDPLSQTLEPTTTRAVLPQLPPPPLPIGPAPAQQALNPGDRTTPFVSVPPPAQAMHAFVNPYEPGPGLGEALRQRITLLGGQLPLWGVLVPLLLVMGVVAALFGSLVAGSGAASEPQSAAVASAPGGEAAAPSTPGNAGVPPGAARGSAGGALERASLGDPAALGALEQKKPRDLGSDEALALATGRVAAQVGAARKLRERLGSDPGLAKDSHVVLELIKFAQAPETSREALSAMAALPGPIAADLLYEVWTGTAERSFATELAQALLLGRDVRPRASPALAVALDLREAEGCEDSARIVSRAAEVGDKRSFAPLSRLLRRTGCGPGKKQDCYPCLRDKDEQLRKAMAAVKLRHEPNFLPK